MSEQIREQVSAFLDGELPGTETELLLKRLTRDGELRESFGRYAVIGEALRGGDHRLLTKGFASRVNLAIEGAPLPPLGAVAHTRGTRWWRPFAGAAVVAGVAAVAIVAMQQRSELPLASRVAEAPVFRAGLERPDAAAVAGTIPGAASAIPATAQNREAISYTVPAASANAAVGTPAARLTHYMFAHSKYSSGLAQRGVLADLLMNDDEPGVAAREPANQVPARAAP